MGNKTERILKYLNKFPYATVRKIAKELDVSTRMVRYVRSSITKKIIDNKAKILIIDVETSPMEVYVWGLYKQRIPSTNVKKDWALLSWSAKWLLDSEIMSKRVSIKEAHDRCDMSIIKQLWELLNEADVVIAHNAVKFDIRKINARFIINNMKPPSPYQVIDTLKITQRNFGFSSHKLDYLLEILNSNERKGETTYDLWKQCVNGNESALEYMEKYNKQDVSILEELYLMIRPWIKSHVNLGLFTDKEVSVCPSCGSDKLDWDSTYYTPANKYAAFTCLNCGAIGRSRYSSITKEKRKNLTVSIAR